MKFQPKYVDSLCGKTCHMPLIPLSEERLLLNLRGRFLGEDYTESQKVDLPESLSFLVSSSDLVPRVLYEL